MIASALCCHAQVMHARSGGNLEVMGIMQGKVEGNTFIIMDAFALPVEGTETRVNAHTQANEYMVQYLDLGKKVCGRWVDGAPRQSSRLKRERHGGLKGERPGEPARVRGRLVS